MRRPDTQTRRRAVAQAVVSLHPRVSALLPIRFWLALLAAIGTSSQAQAQLRDRVVEEPRWLTLHLTQVSGGAYAEGTFEESSFKNSVTSVSHDRLFVGRTVGLGMDGSIY